MGHFPRAGAARAVNETARTYGDSALLASLNLIRSDLHELRFHTFGLSSVFGVAVVRCARCPAHQRMVTSPHQETNAALAEILAALNATGWRNETGFGVICGGCRREE